MVKKFSNIIQKIIIVMIIFQIMFMPVSNGFTLKDIITQGDEFLDDGKANQTLIDQNELKITVSQVYNILLYIGIALSVIVGAVLGIKFITGSSEEQAKIKETLIPYILGCLVVFGSFGIWRLVINLGQDIVGSTTYISTIVQHII